MTDLNGKETLMNAKENLKSFLSSKKYWRTSEIIKFGADNFSNRADRNARVLRSEGFLKRLSLEETKKIFGNTKEQGYEVLGNFRESLF